MTSGQGESFLDPNLVFKGTSMSSMEWRKAVHSASEYNLILLQEKRNRGPHYHELHTNTIQTLDSYLLQGKQFSIPSVEDQEREKESFFQYAQRKQLKGEGNVLSITTPTSTEPPPMIIGFQSGFQAAKPSTPTYDLQLLQAQQKKIASKYANTASVQFHQRLQQQQTQQTQQTKVCDGCKKRTTSTGGDIESVLLVCMRCRKAFHPRLCLFMSFNTLGRIKQLTESKVGQELGNMLHYNWECKQCKTCTKCGSSGNEKGILILCRLCDRGIHENCLGSTALSKDNYFCTACQSLSQSKVTRTPDNLVALQPKLPTMPATSLLGKDKTQNRSVFADSEPTKKQKIEEMKTNTD